VLEALFDLVNVEVGFPQHASEAFDPPDDRRHRVSKFVRSHGQEGVTGHH